MSSDQLALFEIHSCSEWVYLLAHPTDPTLVKIGYTTDLARRLRELRGCRLLWSHEGTRFRERWLHARFVTNRLPGTEWFRLDHQMMAFFGLELAARRRGTHAA
jgi:T5orf172 domain